MLYNMYEYSAIHTEEKYKREGANGAGPDDKLRNESAVHEHAVHHEELARQQERDTHGGLQAHSSSKKDKTQNSIWSILVLVDNKTRYCRLAKDYG